MNRRGWHYYPIPVHPWLPARSDLPYTHGRPPENGGSVQPGDNVYRDSVIRVADLAGDRGVLDGFVFERCELKGPAVMIPQGSNLANNNLMGNADALLWEIPPDRPEVIGAILARNCTFEDCTFVNVGLAGPPEFVRQVRQSLGLS